MIGLLKIRKRMLKMPKKKKRLKGRGKSRRRKLRKKRLEKELRKLLGDKRKNKNAKREKLPLQRLKST